MRKAADGDRSGGSSRAAIAVPGLAAELGGAIRWFERFLDAEGVLDESRTDLLVVFDEIVSNVVTHAYRDREGMVAIEVEHGSGEVTVTVRDEGPAFDPLAREAPDLDRPLAERHPGGLGIHLVRSLCESVRYERRGESNILVATVRVR